MTDRLRRTAAMLSVAILLALQVGCAIEQPWLDGQDRSPSRMTGGNGDSVTNPYRPRMANKTTLEPPADGSPIELSVEQAVMYALERNRDLRVQQLEPVIAGTFEQIERGVFDTELFVEAAYAEERASEIARSTGAQFNVEGNDTSAVAGLRQSLPTGTAIEATVEQDRSISNRAPEQQAARFGLTVTQSLLRGFGPTVNLAAIRQAELETQATLYELRGFTEALLASTEIAYWNFVLAGLEIEIFEQSLDIAKQQRDQVEQRIEVGVMASTEAAAARAEVARREQALIDARSELAAAKLRLLRLINAGTDDDLGVGVTATSDPNLTAEPINDLDDRLRLADRARPELGEARLRLEQGRLDTVVTRNGLLPRLELFIDLGKTGFGDEFGESFARVQRDSYDLAVGVHFSHLLQNRAAEARDLAARTTRQQAAEAVANLQQLVRFEVRLAANELERARQQITATAATRELQERTLEAERERFNVGTSTTLLVAQAQRDLLASRIAEVEAVVHYRIALVELYLAEGSLLERRGITFADRSGE